MNPIKKTKIVCTIGPASENKEGQTGNLEQDNKNAEASDSLHENIES